MLAFWRYPSQVIEVAIMYISNELQSWNLFSYEISTNEISLECDPETVSVK